ncbi:hypothetical protein OTK49_03345 [Vibrio coralliirubri]|uniref:hypothetical protein n=1 Tax=Vibrio coralliirubri TaxID=1516159 RepID=UPI002284146C|nr:hypothetical protein [Vibrio coralliirubri]MCY9861552.1 hypothetical protein [Vibrio coralliirubri]
MGYASSSKIAQVIDNKALGNKKIDVLRDIIVGLENSGASLVERTATIGYGLHYSNDSGNQKALLMVAACVESNELLEKGKSLALAASNENLRKARLCFSDMNTPELPENDIRCIMLSALLYVADNHHGDEHAINREQSTVLRAVELNLS